VYIDGNEASRNLNGGTIEIKKIYISVTIACHLTINPALSDVVQSAALSNVNVRELVVV
jgi:hypothetical protein